MDSDVLVIARPDRLPRIECRGGIAARATLAETVHLISAAATPLGGDTISIRVIVEAGARLSLRSAAATIALPSVETPQSQARFDLEVAGDLDIDMEPTIVAAGATHHSTVVTTIDGAGTLRLRERVQIGRSDERSGFWSGTVRADAKGRPLLRHRVELGAGAVADDVLSSPRAGISELRYPTEEIEAPPGAVLLDLAAGGVLMTWQGDRLIALPS
ncbi:urease accessory protein UreD [Mycolicibacterium komossense]|uniref:Urease accessory protein UreD n=1 Tax=Mycolicibacterium komossense TaxID=1779 RepID=A0ABT3CIV3_9MYCO|nr:urease accessory protein UreD [Mycolicibacterium komossense]MCV7229287.1 urease accessory protein UreD [Mycolicibacterium komossense]